MEPKKVSLLAPVMITLFFNPIFGILSIIYAVRSSELSLKGDKQFAKFYANQSKDFLLLGYTVSIIAIAALLFITNFSTWSLIWLIALGITSIVTMLSVDL